MTDQIRDARWEPYSAENEMNVLVEQHQANKEAINTMKQRWDINGNAVGVNGEELNQTLYNDVKGEYILRDGQRVRPERKIEGTTPVVKETARHYASDFMAELKTICEEKGIDEFLHENTTSSNSIVYTLKQNENIGTPHLTFTWSDRSNIYSVIKIHMVNPVKQYNKRVNLRNEDKWKSVIEESIIKLVEQNASYTQTRTHLEKKIADLGIKADRIAKFKSFWQIDFKYNDHGRGAIIQYDEKTKEFLFQLRYSNEGTVFKMLEQIAGDLNRI